MNGLSESQRECLYILINLEKSPYAAPPNMHGTSQSDGYKNAATAQQSHPQPYVYTPSSLPSSDQHLPNPDTDPFVKGFEFSTESIRRGFIRKVYSILSVKLTKFLL